MDFHITPFGDQAVMIEVGEEISPHHQQKVQAIANLLEENKFDWLVEYVPGYTTIAVFYNPLKLKSSKLPFVVIQETLEPLLQKLHIEDAAEPREITIPVCYGGEFGPDLEEVAAHNNLTPEEVIEIHTNGDYLVYMIGFAPGFPFIGGMSEKIATPRKQSPRLKIPAGSVGIAGKQTGVYPIETPGGWQLIGKTPLKLFTPDNETPSLLKAGDKIKFQPITIEEFKEWEEKHS